MFSDLLSKTWQAARRQQSDAQRTYSPFLELDYELVLYITQLYLNIPDVMRLRRLNRAFYVLTHEPMIWKAFIREIRIPLPVLPPTFNAFSIPRNSQRAFELEQAVTRAVSLDDNWRSPKPQIKSWRLVKPFWGIVESKILPGGKYMVTSQRHGTRFHIGILCLDHSNADSPLARAVLPCRAYDLQARWGTHGGVEGILVMFLLRSWAYPDEENQHVDYNEYTFHTDLDPPYQLKYETRVLFFPIEPLELVANATRKDRNELVAGFGDTPAFQTILRIHSHRDGDPECPFVQPTLFMMQHPQTNELLPYASVIKRHPDLDEFFLIDLGSKEALALAEEGRPFGRIARLFIDPEPVSLIRTFVYRIFPEQRQVFMIRGATKPRTPPYMFHMFDIPEDFVPTLVPAGPTGASSSSSPITYEQSFDERGSMQMIPFDEIFLPQQVRNIINFHITDPPQVEHIGGVLHPTMEGRKDDPPRPLQIIMRSHGCTHMFNMSPTRKYDKEDDSKWEWIYSLDFILTQSVHYSSHNTYFLPGVFNSLVYTVPYEDRTANPKLVELRRYINVEARPVDYGRDVYNQEDGSVTVEDYPMADHITEGLLDGGKRKEIASKAKYATVQLPDEIKSHLAAKGIQSICWDESIGRVCIVPADDRNKLYVLDLADGGAPDTLSSKWEKVETIADKLGMSEEFLARKRKRLAQEEKEANKRMHMGHPESYWGFSEWTEVEGKRVPKLSLPAVVSGRGTG